MIAGLNLVYEMVKTLDPKLKKVLDPAIKIKDQKKDYLSDDYHSIDLLEKIDHSHFNVFFESYPKKDIKMMSDIVLKKSSGHPFLQEYVKSNVLHEINKHFSLMPYQYFASFSGSRLLFLNAHFLKQLIEFLGVYDVRSFLRTSIDQKLISEITGALSETQKAFLKKIQKDIEKVTFKKMPLENWDKQKSSFEAMLYLRGLNRLSKTIAAENNYVRQEIILRLPLEEKAQFLTLSTRSDENLKKNMYEELNTTLDFHEATFAKT